MRWFDSDSLRSKESHCSLSLLQEGQEAEIRAWESILDEAVKLCNLVVLP